MWTRFLTVILVLLLMDEAIPKWGGSGGRGGGWGRGGGGRGGGWGGRRPGGWGGRRPGGWGGRRPGGWGGRRPGGWGRQPGGWSGRSWGSRGGFGGFRTGAGPGSYSSGHSFRNAFLGGALGAVGGMLAFEAGRYIIQSMTTPFSYRGRDYYFDNHPGMSNDLIQCSVPLDELKQLSGESVKAKREAPSSSNTTSLLTTNSTPPTTMQADKVLDSIQYKNGTQPRVITWACRKDVELCCGTDCCPADDDTGLSKVGMWICIFAAIALVVCCCGVLWYMICNGKGGFGGQQPRPVAQYGSPYHQDDYFNQYGPPPPYPPEAYAYQGYPPQMYVPNGYPPYGYPPQYYPPEGYPSPGYPPENYPPEGYPPADSPPDHFPRKQQQSTSQKSDRTTEQQKGVEASKEKLKSKENVPSSKQMEPKSKEK